MSHKEKRTNNRGGRGTEQYSHSPVGGSKHKGSKKPTNQKRRKKK